MPLLELIRRFNMTRLTVFLQLIFVLTAGISCRQDKDSARNEFRERQEAMRNDSEGATATGTPSSEPAPAPGGDKVVAVKDGDTIELLRNGQTVTVRLYGVDAPEKNQDFGHRAKQFASDLAFNKTVRLIVHNTDRYGRTVGTIILPDGRSLNEELVKNGFAWHYKEYAKDKNLENLETDARRFKRGLWQDPNPTAPWEFRKVKRTNSSETAAAKSTTPLPRGATTRQVYLCDSAGSAVYHLDKNCSVLKRCKAETIALTEAEAIRKHSRRLDKTCGPK